MEEGSSNFLLECDNGKEINWEGDLNVGTLVINEERMLECIHMKF
jgi:hypothetical protein